MNLRALFAAVCSTLVLVTSCDLFSDSDPEVTVNCVLSYPDDKQELTLNYTASASSAQAKALKSATVTLMDESENREVGKFSYQESGSWTLPAQVTPGHSYSLHIDIPQGPTLYASTKMPPAYDVAYEPWTPAAIEGTETRTVKTSTRYHLESIGSEALWIYALAYDASNSSWNMVEKIMTDCKDADSFNFDGGSLDLNGHDYDSEPQYSWRRETFKDAQYHYCYLRIPTPDETSPAQFFLDMEMKGPYLAQEEWNNWPGKGTLPTVKPSDGTLTPGSQVVFMVCSKDYDKYLKDRLSYMIISHRSEISAYDSPNISGNVNGGFGIFGACLSYSLPWFPAQ